MGCGGCAKRRKVTMRRRVEAADIRNDDVDRILKHVNATMASYRDGTSTRLVKILLRRVLRGLEDNGDKKAKVTNVLEQVKLGNISQAEDSLHELVADDTAATKRDGGNKMTTIADDSRMVALERVLGSAVVLLSEADSDPQLLRRGMGMLARAIHLSNGALDVQSALQRVADSIRTGGPAEFDDVFQLLEGGRMGKSPTTRVSCIECVEKHLGAAIVLLGEIRDGYPHRLRVIGHLFEAEDESQEYPELHMVIREARIAFQNDGTVPDIKGLEHHIENTRSSSTGHTNAQ